MPPKRTATKLAKVYTPSRIKLEDGAATSLVDSGSDDGLSSATLGRPTKKRRRVEPEARRAKLDRDGGSRLTPVDSDEYEERATAEYAPMDLVTEPAHSPSRPALARTTASAKTPLKQMKLDMFLSPAGKDSKLAPDETTSKPSTHASASPSKKPANPSPRKQKAIAMQLKKPHPAPPNWEEQYALIEEMRAGIQAPVDTMGCAAYMSREGPLKVSFSRRKVEYLRATATTLRDKFNGDVPKTVDELCSLPGIGPKMAFLVLQVAWDINVGIGVDVHVHRITNRIGWQNPPTTTPEQTRLNLQSWLPRNSHAPINPLLVGFGQVVCLPVGPRCGVCLLSSKGLCPSARVGASSKGKKPIIFTPKSKVAQAEAGSAPDLGAEGLVRLSDEAVEYDVGQPRVQIKLEE